MFEMCHFHWIVVGAFFWRIVCIYKWNGKPTAFLYNQLEVDFARHDNKSKTSTCLEGFETVTKRTPRMSPAFGGLGCPVSCSVPHHLAERGPGAGGRPHPPVRPDGGRAGPDPGAGSGRGLHLPAHPEVRAAGASVPPPEALTPLACGGRVQNGLHKKIDPPQNGQPTKWSDCPLRCYCLDCVDEPCSDGGGIQAVISPSGSVSGVSFCLALFHEPAGTSGAALRLRLHEHARRGVLCAADYMARSQTAG